MTTVEPKHANVEALTLREVSVVSMQLDSKASLKGAC